MKWMISLCIIASLFVCGCGDDRKIATNTRNVIHLGENRADALAKVPYTPCSASMNAEGVAVYLFACNGGSFVDKSPKLFFYDDKLVGAEDLWSDVKVQ